MSNEDYEANERKCEELEDGIMKTSLLLSKMKDDGKCPYCRSDIATKDEIREGHIKQMQEYNKVKGRKDYLAYIEGSKRWEI